MNIDSTSRMKAGGSSQKEMLFMRGNAMSGAPIMIGTNQLPKPPISAGMTMKKIMIRPWPVTNTLYMCLPASMAIALVRRRPSGQGRGNLDARLGELPAHHHGQETAEHAREDREDQVQRADVLVVGRKQVQRRTKPCG
jgi:hypothetical protein